MSLVGTDRVKTAEAERNCCDFGWTTPCKRIASVHSGFGCLVR
jgi:hypothetical protein